MLWYDMMMVKSYNNKTLQKLSQNGWSTLTIEYGHDSLEIGRKGLSWQEKTIKERFAGGSQILGSFESCEVQLGWQVHLLGGVVRLFVEVPCTKFARIPAKEVWWKLEAKLHKVFPHLVANEPQEFQLWDVPDQALLNTSKILRILRKLCICNWWDIWAWNLLDWWERPRKWWWDHAGPESIIGWCSHRNVSFP